VVETAKTITTTAEADVPGTELAELLDEQAIAKLAVRARAQAAEGGLKLLGSDGLLQALTKQIIEAALEAELDDHLSAGARPDPAGGAPGKRNERNGRRGKKISTEVGPVQVIVPRDRAGSFAPSVVAKSSRRTSGIDEMVISLIGKGLTTGEVAAHLKEVFGVQTSKETVSAITDRVLGRNTSNSDADGNVTKTAYTPATGAEPTSVVVTFNVPMNGATLTTQPHVGMAHRPR